MALPENFEPAVRDPKKLRRTALILVAVMIVGGWLVMKAYTKWASERVGDDRPSIIHRIQPERSLRVVRQDGEIADLMDLRGKVFAIHVVDLEQLERSRLSLDALKKSAMTYAEEDKFRIVTLVLNPWPADTLLEKLNETATQSLQVGVPVQGGAFGLSINAFGFELFKERKIGLAYARKMSDKLRVGLQLNYESLAFGDVYGNSYTMTFEGGFQYSLNDQFVLAGHVVNPNKSKYRGAPELAGPSELRGGVRYLFSDNIFVVGEARKNSEEDVRLLFGTEFQVVDFLIVRLGVSTEPTLMSFGLGFNYRAFHFALSSDYHNELGITPTFALRYVRS